MELCRIAGCPHCNFSSDAVIVYYGGVRSVELDHREVVGLLQDVIGEKASAAGNHVSRVIAKKNLVEYEDRLITQAEARDAGSTLVTLRKKVVPSEMDILDYMINYCPCSSCRDV